MVKIDRCGLYTDKEDANRFAVLRVSNSLIKSLGGRKSWVTIKNISNGKKIYRTLRGAGSRGLKKEYIELDYDGILDLQIDNSARREGSFTVCELEIKKASVAGYILAHWHHPDPAFRVPMKIAVLSGLISIFSLFITIFS